MKDSYRHLVEVCLGFPTATVSNSIPRFHLLSSRLSLTHSIRKGSSDSAEQGGAAKKVVVFVVSFSLSSIRDASFGMNA